MIDWKRVGALRDELGESEFSPVIELFLDEVEGIVMRLNHADAPRLESDLHLLLGSASNLGFAAFGRLCHLGVVAAREGKAEDFDIAGLLDCYAASKKEFVAGIGAERSGVA